MSKQLSDTVDTRRLKSGKIRLRFKLSEWSYGIIERAFCMTEYKYSNSSLDAICMSYLNNGLFVNSFNKAVSGSKRLLVTLYPDEYEIVKAALSKARTYVKSDAKGLLLISMSFIVSEIGQVK